MRTSKKALACLIVMVGLIAGKLSAQGAVVNFPYFGDVGIKNEGGRYTVALGSWGTWAAKGHFNSNKDYRLTTAIPVDNFIGYIPVAGQVLGVLGLSTVELTLQPTGVTYSMICESGGLGLLRGTVSDALGQNPTLRMVIDKVIEGLEIRSLRITGAVISKDLKGAVEGELAIIGKSVKFSGEGELSLKGLVSIITDRVVPVVTDYAAEAAKAVYKEARSAALAAGRETANLANYAYDQARQGAHNVTASVKHGGHSADQCLNECVPRYAESQGNPMREGAARAVNEFLNPLRDRVLAIEGATTEETVALRFAQFDAEWYQLALALDQKWAEIYNDREVDNYFFKDASEKAGRERYRGLIKGSWDKHQQDRRQILQDFLLAPNPRLSRPKKAPALALQELAYFAKAATPVNVRMRRADLAWNLAGNAPYDNGSNVNFERYNDAPTQRWILVSAGKPDSYHIKSVASGRFIHIAGANDAKASSLVTWDGASTAAPQTVFKASADADGCIRFSTGNGFAFDLQDGAYLPGRDLRLWERNGADAQAFYVSQAGVSEVRPFLMPLNVYLSLLNHYAKNQTPVFIRNKVGDLAMDLTFDTGTTRASNGNGITFYTFHGQANQRWILVPVEGQPYTFHFKSAATGQFIHIAGAQDQKGQRLVVWEGAGPQAPQTIFRVEIDRGGFFHFKSGKGFAMDLTGGSPNPGSPLQLWDNTGGDPQALFIYAAR